MKKIISMVAAITMICAFSTTAFAASTIGSTTSGSNSGSHDVLAKYNGSVSTPDVYSVDVEWGAMEFTYNVGGTKEWNPKTHNYTDNSTASWSAANGSNIVTVTNHSNQEVTATFGFEALSAYSSTITGSFSPASTNIPSAVGKELKDTNLVATSELTLSGTVSGSLTDFTEIGSVTVTIS